MTARVLVVMTASSDTLHSAVSSAVVQCCRKLLSCSGIIQITGSITVIVDGEHVRNRIRRAVFYDTVAACW